MPKKKDFDKIEYYVLKVLEENKSARDDDMLLYYYVCSKMTANKTNIKAVAEPTFFEVATAHKELGFPSYETVSRARRKIVYGARPDLQSFERRKIRQAQIPDYIDYATA